MRRVWSPYLVPTSVLIAGLALTPGVESQEAPDLLLAANLEIRPAIEQAIDEFSREADCLIRTVWHDSGDPPAVASDADIFVWQESGQRAAGFARLLEPGTERLLGQKSLAILTKQGNPKRIATLSDLGKPGVRVGRASKEWKSLDRASDAVFERTGIGREIGANIAERFADSALLVKALGEGTIDAALGWDVLEGLSPCEVDATPLPERLASPVSIRAAVNRQSHHKEDAQSFADFLASVVGQAVLGRYGYRVPLHHGGATAYDALVERRLKRTYPLTAGRMINESGITKGICLDIGVKAVSVFLLGQPLQFISFRCHTFSLSHLRSHSRPFSVRFRSA